METVKYYVVFYVVENYLGSNLESKEIVMFLSMLYVDNCDGQYANRTQWSRILPEKICCSATHENFLSFLGAFAKFRKATLSFFLSVCLSLRMEQLGSHWTDFDEI
jgi:hypothetical protein